MNIRHFKHFPKPYLAYPKVIKGLILKNKNTEKALPEAEYIVDSFKVDVQHLAAYNKLTDFAHDGEIPALYLAVLSQSLQMHMMTAEQFPFAILGLVHIRNKITQYRKVYITEELTLSCRFGELRPHDKGLAFDFITTVYVAGEVVVEGLTTYLSRQKTQQHPMKNAVDVAEPNYELIRSWRVAEDMGRRYAKVSGDFNLIHLHALTAKAFGFKQAIAHGMWSNAKALANIHLPDAYEADVTFKLPIYLPSQIDLLVDQDIENTSILIRNNKNKKPHIVGKIKAL